MCLEFKGERLLIVLNHDIQPQAEDALDCHLRELRSAEQSREHCDMTTRTLWFRNLLDVTA
jgi:hypothetical protein